MYICLIEQNADDIIDIQSFMFVCTHYRKNKAKTPTKTNACRSGTEAAQHRQQRAEGKSLKDTESYSCLYALTLAPWCANGGGGGGGCGGGGDGSVSCCCAFVHFAIQVIPLRKSPVRLTP
uniref:Uncharacterized protein n=1 Tax=Glossina austeni TaxID=7395 RepID=A0A1A9V1Y6_GLOAU